MDFDDADIFQDFQGGSFEAFSWDNDLDERALLRRMRNKE